MMNSCYDELTRLVDRADFSDSDEIIALGDIVDRGPNPLRLIDFYNFRANARSIMGNHEADAQ